MNKGSKKKQVAVLPTPRTITSLAELEALCDVPIAVTIPIRGQLTRCEGRRLTPAETRPVKLLLEQEIPPIIPAERPSEEPRYNLTDPEFQKRKDACHCQARALALWCAFPMFKETAAREVAEKKFNRMPENTTEITQFIQDRKLEDDILETLFSGVLAEVVGPGAYLGFSSDSKSPKS